MPLSEEKKRDKKDEIVFAYINKEVSHKLASNLLRDLGYQDWEINLFLDNDQTGPE